MSASLGLFRLQQVDRKIDQAKAQLETIRKTLENDSELRAAVGRLEASEEAHRSQRQSFTSAEAEAERQKTKIAETESSLYGGKVHNPKELTDLQRDVVSLKKHLTTLEDGELEWMVSLETAENELTAARAALEVLQSKRGEDQQSLIAQQTERMSEVDRLGEERAAALAPIEVALLKAYEDLRIQKRGVAVTDVKDGECAACGTTINAALQQTAKSANQLAYCPTCGRILFMS